MKEIILLLTALLLTAALLGLAWRRADRRHRAARLLATLLAAGSLTLLALPPTITVTESPGTAILLTPGYAPDTLQALLRRLPARPLQLSYRQAVPGYQALPDLAELARRYPRVRQVHLLGFGLEAADLQSLGGVQLIAHLSPPPAGVTAVNWQQEVSLGEALVLTGRLQLPAGRDARLYLKLGERVLDSAALAKPGQQRFTLRYTPRQEGRYVYRLTSKAAATAPETEVGPVAVQIRPRRTWRVLLLPSAPGFEFKFLKNYLISQQHAVAMRIPVSRDIYQTEFGNTAAVNLERLGPELLRRFDLVVTDTRLLQDQGPAEGRALSQAIAEGLGLLVLPEALPLGRQPRLLRDFYFTPVQVKGQAATLLTWEGQRRPVAAAALPQVIRAGGGIQALVRAPQGLVAARQPQGWGTVALALLPQTYSWQLAGQQQHYAAYWAHVLGEVVRQPAPAQVWQVREPLLARVNQAVRLELLDYQVSAGPVPQARVSSPGQGSLAVSLEQDAYLPHRFTGTYWPRQAGWHQVRQAEEPTRYFYVYPPLAWQAVAQSHTLNQTLSFIQRQGQRAPVPETWSRREPVAGGWFFLLFLLSAAYLWIEEKL